MTLDHEEYRDLLERGQQITELTELPAWKLLVDFVNELRFKKQQAIIAGLPPAEYAEAVAWLKGADYVIRASEYLNGQIAALSQAERELADA